jgi:hypothetical protein
MGSGKSKAVELSLESDPRTEASRSVSVSIWTFSRPSTAAIKGCGRRGESFSKQSRSGARVKGESRSARPHWAAFPTVKKAMRRRLRALGLWNHIHAVDGPVAKGARGASFISHNNQALLKDLLSSGHFGRDRHVGRIFHREGVSLRELCAGSGLHVVLKVGNRVEVHIDRICPAVATTAAGWCCYKPRRVAGHFRHDVLPVILPHLRPQPGRGATPVASSRSRRTAWVPTSSITVCATTLEAGVVCHQCSIALWSVLEGLEGTYILGSAHNLSAQPKLSGSSRLPRVGGIARSH